MTTDTAAFARALLAAYKTGTPVQRNDIASEPATLDDAYAVHRQVMAEIGPAGAFKTSKEPDGQQIMAPIVASGVRPSGASFTADELNLAGIELEIAFRLEAELPSPGSDGFDDILRASVVAVPVIEVVDTRLAFHETCHPMAKLADSQFNAGLVVGEPVRDWQDLNLNDPMHTFQADGATVSEGVIPVPGGIGAFAVLRGFLDTVDGHCGGFKVGQYLTTGALSGLIWIEKGKHVTGHIDGLGDVEVRIEG